MFSIKLDVKLQIHLKKQQFGLFVWIQNIKKAALCGFLFFN